MTIRNDVEGEWRESGAASHLSVVNPATAEELGCVPLCGSEEVEAAAQAAARSARRSVPHRQLAGHHRRPHTP